MSIYTEQTAFFGQNDPFSLVSTYGSPLYIYNEQLLRQHCKTLKKMVTYPHFSVNYSVKANSNLSLLKIIQQEGLKVDAMSPGEIYIEQLAGFQPEQILYISNNVADSELQYAIDAGVRISVDSLSQLDSYGRLNPHSSIAIRLNPMVGAGHHQKVVTGGKKTKFGIAPQDLSSVKQLLKKYDLTLIGLNQHIGSLFMEANSYIEAATTILTIAQEFTNLEFIDLGGGFGIDYQRYGNYQQLDFQDLGQKLDCLFHDFVATYGRPIEFKIEPGRYTVAESGLLLGQVTSLKENFGTHYVGSDLGFNILQRPMLYDSYHALEVYRQVNGHSLSLTELTDKASIETTLVGNICESGDILAKDRLLPSVHVGDLIGVLDAGAYGYSMASNYNQRLRPAEVLITLDGQAKLIRRRDSLEDLIRGFTEF